MRLWRRIAVIVTGISCSAMLGTGCNEKTSADSPSSIEDTASLTDGDGSGPIEIGDDWHYTPPPPASARR